MRLPAEHVSFQDQARYLVMEYTKRELIRNDQNYVAFTQDDVYVVWACKTLENWKALVGTTLPDRRYYEVTHSGTKNETYIDVYTKVDNLCIPETPTET